MGAMTTQTKGFLVLATGDVFPGWCFGAAPDEGVNRLVYGEAVFNTSLTGYQEILTDPSYKGQIVVMTASHVGNYGINLEDVESQKIYLSGFVVQEVSERHSNWRATMGLHEYLEKEGVPGLTGIDTRAVTRLLRTKGAVTTVITKNERDLSSIVKRVKKQPTLEGQDLVKHVTTPSAYQWREGTGSWNPEMHPASNTQRKRFKVVVLDFGVKQNILRCLVDQNCDVTVVPATTPASQITDMNPDGILISNGPGDPAVVSYGIKTLERLIDQASTSKRKGEQPPAMFGICLGHQLLGLALGGRTYKLKFGHHGANHPIKDLETGRVDITTQNHGFAVEGDRKANNRWAIKGNRDVVVTHVNLNDNAVEGLRHETLPIFSVQYHPEASSGPHDASHLFHRFVELMEKREAAKS